MSYTEDRTNRRPHGSGKPAYRVRVTSWERGSDTPRKRTFLVPANSSQEAESIARRNMEEKLGRGYHGGYNMQSKMVAREYRERD